MQKPIIEIVSAARRKFGVVMSATLIEEAPHGYFFFVACRRDNPPVADRPYMTITAKFDREPESHGDVSFFHGHYDLTIDRLHEETAKVKSAA